MADSRERKPSLRELRERGVKGTKGPRDAKSVLAATREARRLQERHDKQVAAAKRKNQSTDSNQ